MGSQLPVFNGILLVPLLELRSLEVILDAFLSMDCQSSILPSEAGQAFGSLPGFIGLGYSDLCNGHFQVGLLQLLLYGAVLYGQGPAYLWDCLYPKGHRQPTNQCHLVIPVPNDLPGPDLVE